MNAITPSNSAATIARGLSPPSANERPGPQRNTREVFQDFVAGTFYKQMLKSLRSTQEEPAYFHGGQAENVFRGQLDQHLAEEMARDHGEAIADPLYPVFVQQLKSAAGQTEDSTAPAENAASTATRLPPRL